MDNEKNGRVLVVGGGASGMLCAAMSAALGARVTLFERNEKLGKKLFLTGKGRCNLTNAAEINDFFDSIHSGRKFMYSSLYGFSNEDTVSFFEERGLHTQVERGNRVFPKSGRSSDVIKVLSQELTKKGVDVRLNTRIKKLLIEDGRCAGLVDRNGRKWKGEKVVIATGGLSYPLTGSTGDGFLMAEEAGHTVTALTPGLVPFNLKDRAVPKLMGLSLKNTGLKILDGDKELFKGFGELLFTHFGISGPLILTASEVLPKEAFERELTLHLDLKSALSEKELDERLKRDFEENKTKFFKNSLSRLFPSKLIPLMVERSGIEEDRKCSQISAAERLKFGKLIKDLTFRFRSLRSFEEAVITRGGVELKEIEPSTMASKIVKGLYFIGEVLDVDAETGGFNLQIAWSTAAAAARAVAGAEF